VAKSKGKTKPRISRCGYYGIQTDQRNTMENHGHSVLVAKSKGKTKPRISRCGYYGIQTDQRNTMENHGHS
jgi:hypothetical protein